MKQLTKEYQIVMVAFLLNVMPVINGRSTTYTWNGLTSTGWMTDSNWAGGFAPVDSITDDIIIPGNCLYYPVLDSAISRTIGSLTIDSGASLSLSYSTSAWLSVYGNLTNNGTLYNSGEKYVFLKGGGKTIGGTGNFLGDTHAPLYFDEGSSYMLSNDISIRHIFISSAGSLDLNGYNISTEFFFQLGSFYLRAGTLSIGGGKDASMWYNTSDYFGGLFGDQYNSYITDSSFFEETGTVYYNAGDTFNETDQSVRSATYYNLKIRTNTGYTVTMGYPSAYTVSNNLEIINPGGAGGIATVAYPLTLNGNFYLGNTGDAFILNLDNRIARSSAGTGILMMGNLDDQQINITYTDSINHAISLSDSADIHPLTFYGTVNYTSDSVQKVMGAVYKHLTVNGSGIRSLAANTTINGNLTINAGTFDPAIANYNIDLGGNLYNKGTFVQRNNTLTLNGLNAQSIINTSGIISDTTTSASGTIGIPDNTNNGNGAALDNDVPVAITLASIPSVAKLSVTIPGGIYTGLDRINFSAIHPSVSQLDFYLVSPDSTVLVISTDNGGSGDNYSNVTFSDTAATEPPTTNTDFSDAVYRPEVQSFASYTGQMNGTWTLYAIDDGLNSIGTLTNFSVTMNCIPSLPLNLYNVIIDNSGEGITIHNDINITSTGTITLSNGPFILNDHKLILHDTVPTAVSAGNVNSYIVSETNAAENHSVILWKMGEETGVYVFPLGVNGDYIPFTFNKTTTGATSVSVSTRATVHSNNLPLAGTSSVAAVTNLNSVYGGSAISSVIDRWWDISTSTPVTASLTFTYRGSENTMSSSPTGMLNAQNWNGTGWDMPTGNGMGVTSGTGTVSVGGVSNFSPWILVSSLNPLPVKLLNFVATCNSGSILINWSTASENNNDFYTVDKSNDGVNFLTVGKIKSKGDSDLIQKYSFTDPYPVEGISYYHLIQTDYNGHSEISKLISVENCVSRLSTINAFCTTEGNLALSTISAQPENYSLKIINILGRLMHAENYNVAAGENLYYINKKLGAGAYFIVIDNNKEQVTKKVIIN